MGGCWEERRLLLFFLAANKCPLSGIRDPFLPIPVRRDFSLPEQWENESFEPGIGTFRMKVSSSHPVRMQSGESPFQLTGSRGNILTLTIRRIISTALCFHN